MSAYFPSSIFIPSARIVSSFTNRAGAVRRRRRAQTQDACACDRARCQLLRSRPGEEAKPRKEGPSSSLRSGGCRPQAVAMGRQRTTVIGASRGWRGAWEAAQEDREGGSSMTMTMATERGGRREEATVEIMGTTYPHG